MKILYAEDEQPIRESLTRFLSKFYDIDTAENGAEAYDMVQKNEYDLIISDINMPKMSGLELCKKLTSEGYMIPIIFTTGNINIKCPIYDTCDKNKKCDILPKPFDLRELMDKIKEFEK